MPVLTVALMGFLAFTAGPVAPGEAPIADARAEVSNTTLALADAPVLARAEEETTHIVKLTSYNAVPEQTDGNPFETASGAYSNPEVVAARSVDLAADLPFGTVIALSRTAADTGNCRYSAVEEQIGYRVVADSMHSRKRNQIDILLDASNTVSVHGKEVNPSLALGICSDVTIRVIGRLKVSEIPETQEQLRKLVEGDALAMR